MCKRIGPCWKRHAMHDLLKRCFHGRYPTAWVFFFLLLLSFFYLILFYFLGVAVIIIHDYCVPFMWCMRVSIPVPVGLFLMKSWTRGVFIALSDLSGACCAHEGQNSQELTSLHKCWLGRTATSLSIPRGKKKKKKKVPTSPAASRGGQTCTSCRHWIAVQRARPQGLDPAFCIMSSANSIANIWMSLYTPLSVHGTQKHRDKRLFLNVNV